MRANPGTEGKDRKESRVAAMFWRFVKEMSMSESLPEKVRALLRKLLARHEEEIDFPRDRLKQIESRMAERQDMEQSSLDKSYDMNDPNDKYDDIPSVKNDQLGVVRWCGNEDRFVEQDVRKTDQLGGAVQHFEIDPMNGLLENNQNQ